MSHRAELERVFRAYESAVLGCLESGDWSSYPRLFTEDGQLTDHLYGEFRGRQEIAEFAKKSLAGFPGREFAHFASDWEVFDEERAWVISRRQSIFRAPGDGSVFAAPSVVVLKYAGDGLWAESEQIYNPELFSRVVVRYVKRCHSLGTLSEEGREWANWADIALDSRQDPNLPDVPSARS